MNLEEKVTKRAQADLVKLAKIKTWGARIKKLSSRKSNPLSEARFCLNHGINKARFNRMKNLKDDHLPADEFIQQVEDALKAEKV
jgi:hypothetical protein